MGSLLLVVGVFVLFIYIHRVLHMYLKKHLMLSYTVTLSYLFGLIPLTILLYFIGSEVIYSSIILYLLLSLLMSFLYLGVVLGGETPSSMILNALKNNPHMTKEQILSIFSEKILIWKRIEDLSRAGLIKIRESNITATTKGKNITRYIKLYETLFNRMERG
jgi:hypothetical protein